MSDEGGSQSEADKGKNKEQKEKIDPQSESESDSSSSSDAGKKEAPGKHDTEEDEGNQFEYPPTWPVQGLDFENDSFWSSTVKDWSELDNTKDHGPKRITVFSI